MLKDSGTKVNVSKLERILGHVLHIKWIWGFVDFYRGSGVCLDHHERRQFKG